MSTVLLLYAVGTILAAAYTARALSSEIKDGMDAVVVLLISGALSMLWPLLALPAVVVWHSRRGAGQ